MVAGDALSDRFVGRRGLEDDRWDWSLPERAPRRARRWRLPGGLVAAAALLGVGAALVVGVLFAVRAGDRGRGPGETPGPAATPTVTGAASPTPEGPLLRLGLWAKGPGAWAFDEPVAVAGYAEGESIPFLLRIDDAVPGRIYPILLSYDCRAGAAAGFDFLTGYDHDQGSAPALAAGGPGRLAPDASLALPDDPSIAFDDAEGEGRRLLSLWGATFEGGPVGLELAPPCAGDRTLRLGIRAGTSTAYLLWGGHLAASADWGAGLGATDADQPFAMDVQVFGVAPNQRAVLISPGSMSR